MNRVTALVRGGWDFHTDVQRDHIIGARSPILFVGPYSTFTFKIQTNPRVHVTLYESLVTRLGMGRRMLPNFRFVGEPWGDNS